MDSFIIWILMALLFIGLLAYGVIRLLIKLLHGGTGWRSHDSSLAVAFSREDAVGQLLVVVGIAFAGLTLYNLDRNIGSPVSWTWVLLITTAVAIGVGFWKKLLYPTVVGSVAFFVWVVSQAAIWIEKYHIQPISVVTLLALIFLTYYLLGAIFNGMPKWKRYGTVFTTLGFIGVVFMLLGLSTSSGLQAFAEWIQGDRFYTSSNMLLLTIVVVCGFIAALAIAYKRKVSSYLEAPVLATLAFIFICLLFAPTSQIFESGTNQYWSYNNHQLTSVGTGWTILFNILTFLLMVGVVYSGYVRTQTWRINIGAGMLFLFILFKYFDWFYTFLDKSAFFLVAGVLMFILGYFMEKGRRQILATMQENKTV